MGPGTWEVFRENEKVVLIMRGHYSYDSAVASSEQIMAHLADIGRGEFIVDLTTATSFDKAARQHWQGMLKEFAARVHTVGLVNGPPLLRMAGSAVCLYAGVKLRIVSSVDEALGRRARPRAS